MTKLSELKSKLETLTQGLTNPQLKTNQVLRKSLEKKIFEIQDEIEKLERAEVEKPKAIKVKEPIAKTKEQPIKEEKVASKKEIIKKEVAPKKQEAPKKEVKQVSVGNFNEGDKVSFIDKDTNQKTIGEIKSIVKGSSPGSFNAIVITTNGDRKKMRISKIEKV